MCVCVHLQPAAMPDCNACSQNDHAHIETSGIQENHYSPLSWVTQIGVGHGGEGAEDSHGPSKRRRTTGREGMQQGWRDPSGKFNLDFYSHIINLNPFFGLLCHYY